MFREVNGFISHSKFHFQSNVQDQFGQSIINDIYDPILNEVSALEQMEEESERQISDINKLLEEARSIKGEDYGY